MKSIALWFGTVAVLAFVLFIGCTKKDSSQAPLAAHQIPQVLDEAFKQAKPEATAAVHEVIASTQSGDPIVLQQAHQLAARADLTDEQRRAAYRAAAALHKKMVDDAARGDQKAQEALEVYRASK